MAQHDLTVIANILCCLVPRSIPRIFLDLLHFILTTALRGRAYHCDHFTGEKVEAGWVTYSYTICFNHGEAPRNSLNEPYSFSPLCLGHGLFSFPETLLTSLIPMYLLKLCCFPRFSFFNLIDLHWFTINELIYNVLLVSDVQHRNSVYKKNIWVNREYKYIYLYILNKYIYI